MIRLSTRTLSRVASAAPRLAPGLHARRPGALALVLAGRCQPPSGSLGALRRPLTSAAASSAEPLPCAGEAPKDRAQPQAASHAVVSTFDLFSIGVGPSSSHTVGPMRAGRIFVRDLVDHKMLGKVASIKIDLYGSLALTGIGHGTPNATLMGLEGELPETVPTETIISRVEAMRETSTISLNGAHRIRFNPDKDMTLHHFESLPQHPNGMRFTVFDADGDMLATNEYFSIGGGFVVNEKTQVAHGENVFYRDSKHDPHHTAVPMRGGPTAPETVGAAPAMGQGGTEAEPEAQVDERTQQDLVTAALPFSTGDDLIRLCEREGVSIAEVVFLNELHWRSREDVISSAYRIWNVMDDSIRRGCLSTHDKLPGRLGVHRRAPRLYQNLMRGIYGTPNQDALSAGQSPALLGVGAGGASALAPATSLTELQRGELTGVFRKKQRARRPHLPHLDYLSVYAIAVNEENAAGGRVVTAPTNGAAGVIPAVLKYYLEFLSEDPSRDILEFLFTSAAIGMLYKRGASISAAEMGCQGE
ncbi:hypothetical protein LPJ61_005758, partial [Coemansia biformis]